MKYALYISTTVKTWIYFLVC